MHKSIFDNLHYYGESSVNEVNNKPKAYNENANYIKNCDFLINEAVANDFGNNENVIITNALYEGAKIDWALSNFIEEGEDYKDLKANLKDIIKADDLDDDQLRSKGKGIIHVVKRVLQISTDIFIAVETGSAIALVFTSNPIVIAITIAVFAAEFVINRLFRLAIDAAEFDSLKKDARDIEKELRRAAKNCSNKEGAKRLEDQADKVADLIDEYSK